MFYRLRQWWYELRHKPDYEAKWPDLPIHYLVSFRDDNAHGAFIVFIDWCGDLDWRRDDQAEEFISKDESCSRVSEVVNKVAMLETRVVNWPRDLKMSIKRVLGEALANAFKCEHKRADDVLTEIEGRIQQKSQEVSRYWTLQACLVAATAMAALLVIFIWKEKAVVGAVGPTPHLLLLAFCCGGIGALLSIILRLGRLDIDVSAERRLHFAEGLARIVAGGIAGVIIGAMVKLGVALPVFSQASMTTLATCTAALLGGASERLVPAIISKVETEETRTKGGS